MKKFQTERESFKKYFANFEGKFCLTSDIWTSLMHRGFLCITTHYIDSEWMLNKRIISFKTINTPHSGKNIATLINDEIIDLGICDKIFTITLDNAYNNDAAIQILKIFWQIKEDGEDNEDFEILEWWKKQKIKYLVLSITARDVLTVHVSTDASEAEPIDYTNIHYQC